MVFAVVAYAFKPDTRYVFCVVRGSGTAAPEFDQPNADLAEEDKVSARANT